MLFTTYGDKNHRAVLLMHGMCQDWRSVYASLHKLEAEYYLIIPAMDGFYEKSGEFTSFTEQCAQIEEYIKRCHEKVRHERNHVLSQATGNAVDKG